jgi:hypothetical protein
MRLGDQRPARRLDVNPTTPIPVSPKMSQEQGDLALPTHQSSDISQRIGSSDSQVTKRRKERFDDAISSAIVAAKIARDAGDSAPLLSPLKTFMESLVALLEVVKVSNCSTS